MSQIVTGRGRISMACQHEYAAYELLLRLGAAVDFWGTAKLERQFAECLKRSAIRTPFRWMPDLVAIWPNVHALYLIDCKSGERHHQTGNHSLEDDSIRALLAYELIGADTHRAVYLFTDWTWIPASDVLRNSKAGPYRGSGSGTPFQLLPKSACRPALDNGGLRELLALLPVHDRKG